MSLTLAGIVLITLNGWLGSLNLGAWNWLHALPIGELGGTLFGAGLLGTLFEYSFRKDEETATVEKFREIIKEQAPAMRDAVDEYGVQGSRHNPSFEDFYAAHQLTRKARPTTVMDGYTEPDTHRDPLAEASVAVGDDSSSSDLALSLADILSDTGSSKNSLVELGRIELHYKPGFTQVKRPNQNHRYQVPPGS